jgi:hypothetical protein
VSPVSVSPSSSSSASALDEALLEGADAAPPLDDLLEDEDDEDSAGAAGWRGTEWSAA